MSRLRIAAVSIVTAAAAGAGLAPAASADTTVMGSTLVNNYDGGVSNTPTVSAQLFFDPTTSTNPVVSPANGVITGWKVKSADDGAVYSLKVLRPNGPVSVLTNTESNFTAVGAVQAPAAVPLGTGVATPTGVIFSYPASLPISVGDFIGVLSGGAVDGLPQTTTNGKQLNVFANNFGGQPFDGLSANLLSDEQHDLLLQATVEYCKVPNLIGQKPGAAQGPLTAADCGTATVAKKKTKKASQIGKIIATDPAPDGTAAPGTAVKLEVGVASCKKAKKKGKKKSASAAAKKKGKKKKGCKKKRKKKRK